VSAVSTSSAEEVEVEVEVAAPPVPSLLRDDRAFAAAPPPPPIPPIGLSGSQPVQSLTASWPAALAGLFANQVTLRELELGLVSFEIRGRRDCAGEEEVEGTAEQSKKEGKKQKTFLTSATPRAASAA
jgi:hypothetical protein